MVDLAYTLTLLLYVAVPFGPAIGWCTGWLLRKVLREPRRSVTIATLDAVAGVVGFTVGFVFFTTLPGTLYEEWVNGQLVTREVTGFVDYWYLFAIAGAICLVTVMHAITKVTRTFCKSPRVQELDLPVN